MENPAPSIVVAIAAPVAAEFVKLTFRALYMRRAGPGSREMTVPGRPSDQLGRRVVTDSPVYDGRGADARLVARIQGVTVLVGNADALFTMVFETDRCVFIFNSRASCNTDSFNSPSSVGHQSG
jgi:hypothetical protein